MSIKRAGVIRTPGEFGGAYRRKNKGGQITEFKDPAKSARVMKALMPMKKLDIATLQRAYDGEEVQVNT